MEKKEGRRGFQFVEIFVEFEGGCIETLRGVLKLEKKMDSFEKKKKELF